MDNKKSVYERYTKEALIKRIQKLETQLQHEQRHQVSQEEEEGEGEGKSGSSTPAIASTPSSPPRKKREERRIDPAKYSTRLVAFKLAYLGKRYGGFEFAAHASLPTIEEELWKAFCKACLIFPENPDVVNFDPWEYSKCGRTDRGVSAFGQVIAIRVRSNRPLAPTKPKAETENAPGDENDGGEVNEEEEKEPREFNDFSDELPYCKILNRLLPHDIKILAWCPTTPEEFSARYDCRERQYRYFFTQPAFTPLPQSLENPTLAASTTNVKGGWLDIEAMRRAAKKFEGTHDFRNFCRVDPCKLNINFERKMFECDVVEVEDASTALPFLGHDEFRPPSESEAAPEEKSPSPKIYYLHVRGTAFLWHQIRCMVAVIFLVGQGLEPPSIVDRLLDPALEPRRPNYQLADEYPLVLWDCLFPRPSNPAHAVPWSYVGEENPLNQHGAMGLLAHTWELWRQRKLDELLAAQLLDVVAAQADVTLRRDARAPPYIPATVRVFEGGNRERLVGKYPPLLKRPRLPSPLEVFDREARRKGYKDAADMREALVRKKEEAAAAAAEGLGKASRNEGEELEGREKENGKEEVE